MRLALCSFVAVLVLVGGVAPVAGGLGDVTTQVEPETECSYPITETDATGTEVTIEEEPESVVTLNPSAAQTMWEIGAEEKVVGVTKHAMNLDGAQERTNISSAGETISPEIITDIEPDLVLAPSSTVVTEEVVEVLREAGLTVYMYPTADSIGEVRERTLFTGELVGECAGAEETVAWMDEEIAIVEEAVSGEPKPDALYVFFGFTAGEETHIHEIIETAGSNNVAAALGIEEYQQPNEEAVAVADPDWIVLNSNSPDIPDSEAYQETTAVQENQTVVIDINHLNRPAPRIVHAITELAETFHPEAYAAALAEAETDETTASDETAESDGADQSDSENSEPDDETTAESDDQTGPGFGIGVVALALASVVVGARVSNRRSQ